MKVLVTGGRNFSDRVLLFKSLDEIHTEYGFDTLIHGGAKGADSLSGEWAKTKDIKVLVFPADWKRYGKSAGMIRNKQMINELPNLVIAFPGGKGTANMVRIAEKSEIKVIIIGNTK